MSSLQFLQESVKSKMSSAVTDQSENRPTFRNNTNFPDGFDLTLLQKSAKKNKSQNSSTVRKQKTKTGAGEEVGNHNGGGEAGRPGDRGETDKSREGTRDVVVVVVRVFEFAT